MYNAVLNFPSPLFTICKSLLLLNSYFHSSSRLYSEVQPGCWGPFTLYNDRMWFPLVTLLSFHLADWQQVNGSSAAEPQSPSAHRSGDLQGSTTREHKGKRLIAFPFRPPLGSPPDRPRPIPVGDVPWPGEGRLQENTVTSRWVPPTSRNGNESQQVAAVWSSLTPPPQPPSPLTPQPPNPNPNPNPNLLAGVCGASWRQRPNNVDVLTLGGNDPRLTCPPVAPAPAPAAVICRDTSFSFLISAISQSYLLDINNAKAGRAMVSRWGRIFLNAGAKDILQIIKSRAATKDYFHDQWVYRLF